MGFIAGLIIGAFMGFIVCIIMQCESEAQSAKYGYIRIDGKIYALTEIRGRDHE